MPRDFADQNPLHTRFSTYVPPHTPPALLQTVQLHAGPEVASVRIAPDGRLAVQRSAGNVEIVDPATCRTVMQACKPSTLQHDLCCASLLYMIPCALVLHCTCRVLSCMCENCGCVVTSWEQRQSTPPHRSSTGNDFKSDQVVLQAARSRAPIRAAFWTDSAAGDLALATAAGLELYRSAPRRTHPSPRAAPLHWGGWLSAPHICCGAGMSITLADVRPPCCNFSPHAGCGPGTPAVWQSAAPAAATAPPCTWRHGATTWPGPRGRQTRVWCCWPRAAPGSRCFRLLNLGFKSDTYFVCHTGIMSKPMM